MGAACVPPGERAHHQEEHTVSTDTESLSPGAGRAGREARSADGSGPVARSSRPKRSEGQWALGEHTPLNPNEEWKAKEGGLAVRDRVLSTYAEQGFASIP